jgi:hypothetical protein
MRRLALAWLATALACTAGCQDHAAQTYPADPLFSNRRPIEAKVDSAAPVLVASADPTLPPIPALVLAAARQDGLSTAALTGTTSPSDSVRVLRPSLP